MRELSNWVAVILPCQWDNVKEYSSLPWTGGSQGVVAAAVRYYSIYGLGIRVLRADSL